MLFTKIDATAIATPIQVIQLSQDICDGWQQREIIRRQGLGTCEVCYPEGSHAMPFEPAGAEALASIAHKFFQSYAPR